MSTRRLYHARGVRGYRLVCTRFEESRVWFGIEHDARSLRCLHCGSARAEKSGKVPRRFRTPPNAGRQLSHACLTPRAFPTTHQDSQPPSSPAASADAETVSAA